MTDTRIVLGMAKSSLNLRGAKGPKLELDLLRLVYAVNRIRETGGEAQGYLLAMTPAIAQRAAVWLTKYEADGTVEIVVANPAGADLEALELEKAANLDGMAAGVAGEDVAGRSAAEIGERLGEEMLERHIHEREPGVRRAAELQPFGIRWDYFGEAPRQLG